MGRDPLVLDNDLLLASTVRSEEITRLFNHTRPDGSKYFSLSSKINGENIAAGQTTPQQVMKSWMNSELHKANILNPNFKTIGIGYFKLKNDSKRYIHYWVQIFSILKTSNPNLLKVGGVTVSSVKSKSVTLKWNNQNQNNAKGYKIYRYNLSTKSYSHLKTIIGTNINSYTDRDLKSASTYKYKIRSYLKVDTKNYYSEFSPVVTINTKPTTPLLKLSSGKKKANISWNKVSKAKGYQLYRSNTKNGKYSLIKKISSTSKTKFTNKNLKKRTYYYKIRSYAVINNVKVYSDYSSIKSVKIK